MSYILLMWTFLMVTMDMPSFYNAVVEVKKQYA